MRSSSQVKTYHTNSKNTPRTTINDDESSSDSEYEVEATSDTETLPYDDENELLDAEILSDEERSDTESDIGMIPTRGHSQRQRQDPSWMRSGDFVVDSAQRE